jgi:putative transposase
MIWVRMLAYITGTVDQELLVRNEYLAAENRILRAQIKGRLLLSDAEKATLAPWTESLGRIVGCREAGYAAGLVPKAHRHKFDGSKLRKSRGRPRVDEETERLVVLVSRRREIVMPYER